VHLQAVADGVHLGQGVQPARAGIVVPRSVGGAVVRTTVKRRLRHLLRARLVQLSPGSAVVVRALPPAAGATSAELDADLGAALSRVIHRGPAR
jgi:ribonuclease P protein component